MHHFSWLGGPGAVSIKSARIHYSELLSLYTVESADHVVHSGASEPWNIDALFFMLGWDRYGFNKKRVGTCYSKHWFFASSGICGTCSAFRCVWGVKHHYTIFHAWVHPMWFPNKACLATLLQTCVSCIRWDLWLTYCILVHPGKETMTHYFSRSGGLGALSRKSAPRYVMLNFWVCIRWELLVT
jgi:hypothetical protein